MIESMEPRKLLTFGYVRAQDSWALTASPRQHNAFTLAIEHVVRHVLQIPDATAVRSGRGVPRLPADSVAQATTVWWWQRDFDTANISEIQGCPNISTSSLVGKDWTTTKFLQVLHSSVEEGQIANVLEPSTEEAEADPAHDDRLSTIEEVSHETDSSLSAMMSEFVEHHMPPGCDEEWWSQLSPEIQLGCYEASTLPSTVEEAP